MRTLIIIAAFLSSLGRLFGSDDKPAYELAEIYIDMRQQVLELDAEKIVELKDSPIWAVLMETGYPDAAVTVVAVADGAASLYFSNGGGMIGAGEHPNVRPASHGLVKMAENFLPLMKKVEKFPVPMPGITCFYVVTPKGVFSYSAKEDDLGEERDKLSNLFHQGHELITQMRIADGKRRAESGRSGD